MALVRLRHLPPAVYRLVRRRLTCRDATAGVVPAVTAEDVVDAVVMASYRAFITDEANGEVVGTVHQFALREIARRTADPKTLQNEADEWEVPTAPLQQGEPDEWWNRLARAFHGMPPAWRRTLLLRQIEGLSGPALARAVGRPECEIGAMLEHGRAYLREHLLDMELDAPGGVAARRDR
jgi:DNA-directed RNA polymerase specialized sigma24 family protein